MSKKGPLGLRENGSSPNDNICLRLVDDWMVTRQNGISGFVFVDLVSLTPVLRRNRTE